MLNKVARRGDDGHPAARSGLTLLEVLLSVSIFLGSLTAILHLLSIGKRSELMTRLQTEAVIRCESKMAEVISGVEELATVTDQESPDNEQSGIWQWSMESSDTGTASLLKVTVSVEYVVGAETVSSFSLSRYLRDPQLFIDAALSESSE